jgi:DNA primase
MASRYSKHTLWQLRNNIPIDILIKDVLQLPCKTSEGIFRFLCPICSEFDSATNHRTNLARCFRCQKNFNPIDIVMADKQSSFRDAVAFLLPLRCRGAQR